MECEELRLASPVHLQESQVESREYQDDSYIHCQPFPEPVSEEHEIDGDDDGDHQRDEECESCACSHLILRFRRERSAGTHSTDSLTCGGIDVRAKKRTAYWNAIVGNGGEESACGWCKDRWGLSWQITPRTLTEAFAVGGDEAKRTFEAMMTMKKIDVAALDAARRG